MLNHDRRSSRRQRPIVPMFVILAAAVLGLSPSAQEPWAPDKPEPGSVEAISATVGRRAVAFAAGPSARRRRSGGRPGDRGAGAGHGCYGAARGRPHGTAGRDETRTTA